MSTEKSTQQSAVNKQPLTHNVEPPEKTPDSTDGNPKAASTTVSGQEILAAIKKLAERLGRYPSMPELTQAHPGIKMGTVRKYFAGYG